jgi:hypothetical protein
LLAIGWKMRLGLPIGDAEAQVDLSRFERAPAPVELTVSVSLFMMGKMLIHNRTLFRR